MVVVPKSRGVVSGVTSKGKKPEDPTYTARMLGVCSLIFYGLTVQDVLNNRTLTNLPRDLDVVELWSGKATVYHAARAQQFSAAQFDKNRLPGITDKPGRRCEDLLRQDGFTNALRLVMRLRPGGLLWQGVQCSSFVFADSSKCQRKADNVAGDATYQPVVDGNRMAEIAAFFFVLCVLRKVHVSIENPAGSQIFNYIRPTMDLVVGACVQTCHRCAYDDGPYPRIGPKPYKFVCTGPWILAVNRKCTCPIPATGQRQHQKAMEVNASGGVCGTSAMPKSAAYPPALGESIFKAWLAKGSKGPGGPGGPGVEELCDSPDAWPDSASDTIDRPTKRRRQQKHTATIGHTPASARKARAQVGSVLQANAPTGSGAPGSRSRRVGGSSGSVGPGVQGHRDSSSDPWPDSPNDEVHVQPKRTRRKRQQKRTKSTSGTSGSQAWSDASVRSGPWS